jgi:hypothetical protein
MSAAMSCPFWCTFDHGGQVYAEPGEHHRELASLDDQTCVNLYLDGTPGQVAWADGRATVNVWVGGGDTVLQLEDAPRQLREMAVMLVEAAQKLEDLDLLGDRLGLR